VDAATILKVLTLLTAAVYIGFTALAYKTLPPFIVFENIVWAALYIAALAVLHYKGSALPLVAIAAFNAGRVSDAIVTSTGELGRLALEHTPLFTLLLVLAILAAYVELSRG